MLQQGPFSEGSMVGRKGPYSLELEAPGMHLCSATFQAQSFVTVPAMLSLRGPICKVVTRVLIMLVGSEGTYELKAPNT